MVDLTLRKLFPDQKLAVQAADLLHVIYEYQRQAENPYKPIAWNLLWCRSRSEIGEQTIWLLLGRLYSGNYITICTAKNFDGQNTIGVRLYTRGWEFVAGKEPVNYESS